ncbi:MAG: MoaD/ThiS family protein [Myxococcota bacterium]
MPQVCVPPPYQGPTRGLAEIEVRGKTVRECIDAVGSRFPGFRDQIFDPEGKVHGFVQLFVNGDEIGRSALDTPVDAGDRIEILAAIAGG